MPTANDLPEVLETTEPERLATGFIFTEGPLWHPDGYWYFVDLRRNQLLRLTPGKAPELVRTTIGGNGTTLDLLGRLIVCEGDDRRLTRMGLDGKVESLVDNYKGGRFNRPNDVICHSNGCLYFTDPDKRRPFHEREIPGPAGDDNLWDGARVYRLAPDGGLSVLANCEYPKRAGAVAGRAHDVRREHLLLGGPSTNRPRCRPPWSRAAVVGSGTGRRAAPR
jgi:sugar lactone lactonase YvrE